MVFVESLSVSTYIKKIKSTNLWEKKTDYCHCLVDKITARGILFVYCRCWTIPVQFSSKMCLEDCCVRCGALIFIVPIPKKLLFV